MNRLLLALALVTLAASAARADLPPPEPFTRYATPTHRIETREDVGDCAFLVTRHGLVGRPDRRCELITPEGTGPAALTIRCEYREWAELSVISKSAAEPYGTAEELAAAVKAGRVARLGRQVFVSREQVPSWWAAPVVTYELRRSAGGIEIVRVSRNPMWQWYVAAIPFTLATLFGGFRVVRRCSARLIAVLLLVLCTALLAFADIGPPAGKRSVPVTTVVTFTEDFPDFAFFAVSYSSTPGPPPTGGTSVSPTLHFVTPGTTIKATGDRRSGGSLYAVPRTVAERNPHWNGFAADFAKQTPPKHLTFSTSDEAWVQVAQSVKRGEVPGAASIRFGGSADVPAGDGRHEIVETYRVARTPAGVAFVSPEGAEAGSEGGKCGNDAPSAVPWSRAVAIAAGAFGTVALLLGGGWLAWRLARRG